MTLASIAAYLARHHVDDVRVSVAHHEDEDTWEIVVGVVPVEGDEFVASVLVRGDLDTAFRVRDAVLAALADPWLRGLVAGGWVPVG